MQKTVKSKRQRKAGVLKKLRRQDKAKHGLSGGLGSMANDLKGAPKKRKVVRGKAGKRSVVKRNEIARGIRALRNK